MKHLSLLITSIIITIMISGCNSEKSGNNPVNISSQVSLNKNNKEHITKGTVEAIMNAFTTGGQVMLYRANHNAVLFSTLGEGWPDRGASIRPGWPDVHVKAYDWHVILIGFFASGNSSYTLQNAIKDLSTFTITLTLNGEVIETEQTPIKPYLEPDAFGDDVAYGYQVGKIYSPDELPVGTYTLDLIIKSPGYEDWEESTVFYVDPN